MKSHLQLIPTGNMTREEWLAYRKTGVGASEVAPILGLSPYKSAIELFYEKVAEGIPNSVENIFMFMGSEQEDFIADKWQYWQGSEESMIANFRARRIIRKCQRVRAYVRNPKFPWLFVSLDRKINVTQTAGEGALEIKTISGYESAKWAAGIPPAHVVQVQTQQGVCEFLFGELATLKDGRRFDVIPFEFHESIFEGILHKTKLFWDNVEKARILATRRFEAERNFNMRSVQELTAELEQYEPAPDGSDAYTAYMAAKYHLAAPGVKAGGEAEFKVAQEHRSIKDQIKDLEEQATLKQNILIKYLSGMDQIDFGKDRGVVTWKPNKNGVRSFRNAIK